MILELNRLQPILLPIDEGKRKHNNGLSNTRLTVKMQDDQNFTDKAKEIDIVLILIGDEDDGHTVVYFIEAQ